LIEATLNRTRLSGSLVYGVSVWRANLLQVEQTDLIITPEDKPIITVDNLEVADVAPVLPDTVTHSAVTVLAETCAASTY
jgi:hypothetical protein